MRVISYQGVDTLSFRLLDELNGLPKGSAFRAFKQARASLREGEDYFYFAAEAHRGYIGELRAAGLVYPSTENLVLITEAGYAKLQNR